jgi:hypothetical protein
MTSFRPIDARRGERGPKQILDPAYSNFSSFCLSC